MNYVYLLNFIYFLSTELKQLEKRQTSKLVEKSQEMVTINYKGNNLEIERSENNNKFKCPIDNCKSMRKTKISIIDHVKRVHQISEEENGNFVFRT